MATLTTPPSSLPPVLVAPPSWRTIDFISDLHLADDMPRTFVAWADYMAATAADAVFILGDLFEAWAGDDARFEGVESRGADVLKAATEQRTVAFMVGNRDFLLGADMLEACGMQALADPTAISAFGETVLVSHGDAWCISDVAYQKARRIVRTAEWQREILSRPLAERRALAATLRSQSEQRRSEKDAPWFDVHKSVALAAMQTANARILIHGHTHHPGDDPWAPNRLRRVLNDWDLDDPARPRAEVLRWQASGFTRLRPQDAGALAG